MQDHTAIYERFISDIDRKLTDANAATTYWARLGLAIQRDARSGNRFDFLRWPSLEAFSVPASWIPEECYRELRCDRDWDRRWFALTRDSKIGTPKDFPLDFGTSPILVQHAFHLLTYERTTHRSLLDCDVIFEVGGGYGSFCRLLRTAGFGGLHVIYDLPYVSAIQRLFLTLSGYEEVHLARDAAMPDRGFVLITDSDLDDAFAVLSSTKLSSHSARIGFVATWSLSEMPISARDPIFPRFHALCDKYLIAFQPRWEAEDNTRYFHDVTRLRPDLHWHVADMPRIVEPASRYVFA